MLPIIANSGFVAMREANQLNAPPQPLSTPLSQYHSINFLSQHLLNLQE